MGRGFLAITVALLMLCCGTDNKPGQQVDAAGDVGSRAVSIDAGGTESATSDASKDVGNDVASDTSVAADVGERVLGRIDAGAGYRSGGEADRNIADPWLTPGKRGSR